MDKYPYNMISCRLKNQNEANSYYNDFCLVNYKKNYNFMQ